ncbi:MAG: Wzz/FepE/Etk N-terminal domain-containing protein, partial [Candidatus Sulfotelmatobacter sp.]
MQLEPSYTLEEEESRHFSLTLRDVIAVLFRQKRILLVSFVIIVLLVVLSGALTPSYMAEMRILVRRERVDPVVTSQPNAPQVVQEEITESELNSEVELLNSQDLLRKVVIANSLQSKQHSWRGMFGKASEEVSIAKAVRQLAKGLKAEPLH